MRAKLYQLDDQLKEQRRALAEARKKTNDERKLRTDSTKKTREQQTEIDQLSRESRELKRRIHQETETHKSELAESQAELRNAKLELSRFSNSSRHDFEPDNVIRDKLQHLFNRCRDWVKRWHNKTPSDVALSMLEETLIRCTASSPKPAAKMLFDKLYKRDPILIRMLGFACLSRMLSQIFFKSPFFAVRSGRRYLEQLYSEIMRGETLETDVSTTDMSRQSTYCPYLACGDCTAVACHFWRASKRPRKQTK